MPNESPSTPSKNGEPAMAIPAALELRPTAR